MSSPYNPLVTDDMLDTLRGFADQGLQRPFTVLRKQAVVANPYGDDTEEWVEQTSTWGWLKMVNSPYLSENSGLVAGLSIYRLELPIDTDVAVGDMIGGEGSTYVVQDTNNDDTLQMWRTLIVRRLA